MTLINALLFLKNCNKRNIEKKEKENFQHLQIIRILWSILSNF